MWTELKEFGCQFRRIFYLSRCNCSCVTFCTNYKYKRDRTSGDRLNSDQFRWISKSLVTSHKLRYELRVTTLKARVTSQDPRVTTLKARDTSNELQHQKHELRI